MKPRNGSPLSRELSSPWQRLTDAVDGGDTLDRPGGKGHRRLRAGRSFGELQGR